MKTHFLLALIAIGILTGCSSDDDNQPNEPTTPEPDEMMEMGQALIRITSVNANSDEVVLTNLGDGSLDVADFFMCLGPGTYAQVSGLTSDNTTIEPSESITLSYDMNPVADGLSIFTTNSFNSTDPNILLDYVQWGAGNQPRVDQAVTAGRWDAATNFVAEGSPYTFNGTATQFGSTFWEGTIAAPGVMRILTVDTTTDEVTLTNLGASTIDVGNYFLCLGPGTYVQIGSVASGSTMLAPEATIVLPYDMNEMADGLSIFATNAFSSSDPEVLLDYVQWGAGNQARVGQAVSAGRWDDTANFVPLGSPYNFTGESEDVGVTFWE